MNSARNHEVAGSIPGLPQWVKDPGSGVAVSCSVGHRCSSDLMLLWLWRSPVAVTLIIPLGWEPPYAVGAALKKKNQKKHKTYEMMYVNYFSIKLGNNKFVR